VTVSLCACARLDGDLKRVFPTFSQPQWPAPEKAVRELIVHLNFRGRCWRSRFEAAGAHNITDRSARHRFVSAEPAPQAQQVEVGLVAELAGHANPAITAWAWRAGGSRWREDRIGQFLN